MADHRPKPKNKATAPDIRIATDLLRHPKIRKLRRRRGADAVLALLELWCWASNNHPDGVLRGCDPEDLELAAGWEGEEGLVCTLLELRLLHRNPEGEYSIHEWSEHQPWVVAREVRRSKARKAAEARWGPKDSRPDTAIDIHAHRIAQRCSSMSQAMPPTHRRVKTAPHSDTLADQKPSASIDARARLGDPLFVKELGQLPPPQEHDAAADPESVIALYREILVPAGWQPVHGGTYLSRDIYAATWFARGALQDLSVLEVRCAFQTVATNTTWVSKPKRRLQWLLHDRGRRLIECIEGGLADFATDSSDNRLAEAQALLGETE